MTPEPQACIEVREADAVVQACGSFALTGRTRVPRLGPLTGARRIAWDLSMVSDIDARGLGALADAARTARARGAQVWVTAASAGVHRLTAVAKLDEAIPGEWHRRTGDAPLCAEPCARAESAA